MRRSGDPLAENILQCESNRYFAFEPHMKIPPMQRRRVIKSERQQHKLSGVRPEPKLAAAVFYQAVNDLRKLQHERRQPGRVLYADARNWVASNNRSWPYSFLNVCDALHLTADLIRAKLLNGTPHHVRLSSSPSTTVFVARGSSKAK